VEIQIPLRITGVPAPLELRPEGIVATIEGAAGERWRTDREPQRNVITEDDFTAFHTEVKPAFYDRVKNQPVRIRGSVYLTVYGNPRRTVLPVRDRLIPQPAPGIGLCAAVHTPMTIILNCRSAFRAHSNSPSGAYLVRPGSYSPFPADANLIPVTQFMQITGFVQATGLAGQAAAVRVAAPELEAYIVSVIALEPVAYIQRDFEIAGLRLADYEVRR
jgi:hypothetical protein